MINHNRRIFFKSIAAVPVGIAISKASIANVKIQNIILNNNYEVKSHFRSFGEPINSDLTNMIDDFRNNYCSLDKLRPDQLELIKYYEEDDLIKDNLKRARNGFPWIALRTGVLVSDEILTTAFNNTEESIYGLDHIYYDSTVLLDKQIIKENLRYTELLFICLEQKLIQVNNIIKIIDIAKKMGIVVVVTAWINNLSKEILTHLSSHDVCIVSIPSVDNKGKVRHKEIHYNAITSFIRSSVEMISHRGLPSATFEDISDFFSNTEYATVSKVKIKGKNITHKDLTIKSLEIPKNCSSILISITANNNYSIDVHQNVTNSITDCAQLNSSEITAFSIIKPELKEMEVTIITASDRVETRV